MIVSIKKMFDDVNLPEYQTIGSSGMDIEAYSFKNTLGSLVVYPGKIFMIGTGIQLGIPRGYECQVRSRSGLAKKGIVVVNQPGTIDSDYRGEVKVLLTNLSENPYVISKGDRIAQLVFCPVQRVRFEVIENLDLTERGTGGFGSSGV